MLLHNKLALTCASPPTRCYMICCMSADNERALQAHSRGLFDKNMTRFGVDLASSSGTTNSAAPPHREPVITHAPLQFVSEVAAPAPGGLATTPKTAAKDTPPANPGMALTSPKTAANTPTGVAISAEAPGAPFRVTLQAAGGASISVPPPGPGFPVVPTKAEPIPGAASTPILTSATAGPSVIPSARTAHLAVAGAATGKPFIRLLDLVVSLPADLFVSHHICVSVTMSQHDIMSCILCTV